ncbi:MAG: hypothetical protein BWY26_01521 [Elusimicrobia bacterium ADurb.Bin231]|nr:MAG: hypothetical protein BWY26_01521 [Elusimicrobia bacterium ADurb.Bin231]
MKYVSCFLSVCLILMKVSTCNAAEFFGVAPKGSPSIISYGWDGFVLGAMLGTSAGYLKYLDSDKEKDIVLGAAYGSVVGTVGGIALGVMDSSKGKKGYGSIILRDMRLGGQLGLAVGGVIGLASCLSSDDWSDFGRAPAWGYIGGAVVGLGIAFYEGPRLVERQESGSIHPQAIIMADSHSKLFPGIGAVARF